MVRTAAISLALFWGTSCFAQNAELMKKYAHRSDVQMTAHDESKREQKVFVTSTSTGSLWLARAGDLADIWNSGTKYPHVWLFVDSSRDKTVKMRESRLRVAVECDEKKFAVLSMVDYAADGHVLRSQERPDQSNQYGEIVPESVAEATANELCPLP